MAKLPRVIMKLFGSAAGLNQIGKFGSFAAGSPAYTTDPTVIQSLSNYLQGWYGAIVGGNSPAIQDVNAIDYLYSYQLAYLMQAGVPEWQAETTYYIGSLVNNGLGNLYVSLTDANINNALTDTVNWRKTADTPPTAVGVGQSPVSVVASGLTYLVDTSSGVVVFNLPATAGLASGFRIGIKDSAGLAGVNAISIVRNGSQQIEGYAGNFSANAPWGYWEFKFNGTDWFLV